MCLTFDYVAPRAAATEYSVATTTTKALSKLAKPNHDDVSCDNLQITLIYNFNGGLDVLSRLPVKSDTAKMAMYNIPSECLGPNDCYLKPCDKLPCNAHLMTAWMTPGEHVDIPETIDVPIYRSLGCGGGGGGASDTYTRPAITLPVGVCVEDNDGSKKMTFKTGNFAATDSEIAQKISDGVYRDIKSDYLLSMRDACWKELQRQLNNNGVKMHHLFECTGEVDPDGNEVVSPEAAVLFMDMLYPNLIPQHDIILCLPPLVGDELVMDASFNVLLSYPDLRTQIPLLGAHHNDVSNPSSEIEQEENLYICANFPLEMMLPNSETGAHIPVLLHSSADFLPDVNEIRNFGKFSNPSVQAQYEGIINRDACPDLDGWVSDCSRFQDACKVQIFDCVKEVAKSAGFCAAFSTDEMFMTNLVGMRIPKTTTHMIASVSSKQASASIITKRMAKKKRYDALRKEADALSPPKRVATESDAVAMETQTTDVSDGASPDSASANALLDRVLAELRAAGPAKIGTHAMVVYMAKGMDASYITSGALVIDSVDFASMTTDHKAQMAAMIQSLGK